MATLLSMYINVLIQLRVYLPSCIFCGYGLNIPQFGHSIEAYIIRFNAPDRILKPERCQKYQFCGKWDHHTFKNVFAIKQLKRTAYNSALRSRKDMRFFLLRDALLSGPLENLRCSRNTATWILTGVEGPQN